MVLTYSLLVPLSGNGSQIKNPISGRDLSCDESRRPPRGPLRGRSGPPALSSDPGGGLRKSSAPPNWPVCSGADGFFPWRKIKGDFAVFIQHEKGRNGGLLSDF